MEITNDDLTLEIKPEDEILLVNEISEKYDRFEDYRIQQLTDIKLVRDAIYNTASQNVNGWGSKIELPDIYELAQT